MRHTPFLLVTLAACSRAPAEVSAAAGSASASAAGAAAASAPSTAPSDKPVAAAPMLRPDLAILWDEPSAFTRVPPKSPARAAEYVIPRVGSDQEDAECVIMTFGPHQGGTVDENAKRWIDQFHPALPTPRRMTFDINGLHVTFVEVTGTFAGNMMPNRQNFVQPKEKPGWRLIGAIVESPSGLWFFKMTGPDATVRLAARPFEDMVRSVRPR